MRFYQTRKFKLLVLILILVLATYFGGKHYLTIQLERAVSENIPDQVELTYNDLSFDPLSGSIYMDGVELVILDSTSSKTMSAFELDQLNIEGWSYLKYLNDQNVSIRSISLINPSGTYKHTELNLKKDSAQTKEPLNLKAIEIENFEIINASGRQLDPITDSLQMDIVNIDLSLAKVRLDLRETGLPQYSFYNVSVEIDSLFYKVSEFDILEVKKIKGDLTKTDISGLVFKTVPKPLELSKLISKERDHYSLEVDTVSIQNISLFNKNSPYDLETELVAVKNMQLDVFRDKLPNDDLSIKPMTSEMLRKIQLPFMVDSLSIGHNKVVYRERVHAYNDGGLLYFDDGHLGIKNLSNNLAAEKLTEIHIDTKFMGKDRVEALWTFNATDIDNKFRFTGSGTNIDLSNINEFSAPNMNVLMDGRIQKLYFDISGDGYQSVAEVKVDFSNVEIAVLDKTNSKRNKFYSSLANMIVKNSSKSRKSKYEEARVSVERDRTKSQFNFISQNLKESLMKVFL